MITHWLLPLIRYLSRTMFGLSVIAYIASSLASELRPDLAELYPGSSWLLLIIVGFGIIGVRLGSVETVSIAKEHRRIWPYIVCGVLVMVGFIAWATASYALVWRITSSFYAAVILTTLMVIMFEE